MKKIKVLVILCLVIFTFNISKVNADACGFVPSDCKGGSTCGNEECEKKYGACEGLEVSTCVACLAICSGWSAAAIACKAKCFAVKIAATEVCKKVSRSIQDDMVQTGKFERAKCSEGDDCVQSTSTVNDPEFVGKCENQLSAESKKKVIKDYIGRENEILATISANKEWGTAISEVSKGGTVFKFPTTGPGPLKFSEFVKNGYLSNEVYQAQDSVLLRIESIRESAAIANNKEPGKYTLKEDLLKNVIGPLIVQALTQDNQILDSEDGSSLITGKNTENDIVTPQGEEELNNLEDNKEDV
ncbi:MAG: hypothetical protein CMI58_04045, partial [Parcubacteria group bacterium]|nr:hypothetical protein [Parcubacteria group bacterium]